MKSYKTCSFYQKLRPTRIRENKMKKGYVVYSVIVAVLICCAIVFK